MTQIDNKQKFEDTPVMGGGSIADFLKAIDGGIANVPLMVSFPKRKGESK